MDRKISAANANRQFSRLLREVREGASYTVTSHGHPVARIVPHVAETSVHSDAWRAHIDRLRAAPADAVTRWSREELYDDVVGLTE